VPAIANSANSWVEVGNIFGEAQIFTFSHSAGRLRPVAPSTY
jgi:hypothetical protein